MTKIAFKGYLISFAKFLTFSPNLHAIITKPPFYEKKFIFNFHYYPT